MQTTKSKNTFYLFAVTFFLAIFLMLYEFRSLYWIFFFTISFIYFFEYANDYSTIRDLDYRILFTIQVVMSWFMIALISGNVIFAVIGVLNGVILAYFPDTRLSWIVSNLILIGVWLNLTRRLDIFVFLLGFAAVSLISTRGYFILLLLICGLILLNRDCLRD